MSENFDEDSEVDEPGDRGDRGDRSSRSRSVRSTLVTQCAHAAEVNPEDFQIVTSTIPSSITIPDSVESLPAPGEQPSR